MINAVLREDVKDHRKGTRVQVIQDYGVYYLYSFCKIVTILDEDELDEFIEIPYVLHSNEKLYVPIVPISINIIIKPVATITEEDVFSIIDNPIEPVAISVMPEVVEVEDHIFPEEVILDNHIEVVDGDRTVTTISEEESGQEQ